MTKMMAGALAVLVVLASPGSAPAHHSLGNFDTTKAVRVTGTVFRFHPINPHSFIYLDETVIVHPGIITSVAAVDEENGTVLLWMKLRPHG